MHADGDESTDLFDLLGHALEVCDALLGQIPSLRERLCLAKLETRLLPLLVNDLLDLLNEAPRPRWQDASVVPLKLLLGLGHARLQMQRVDLVVAHESLCVH